MKNTKNKLIIKILNIIILIEFTFIFYTYKFLINRKYIKKFIFIFINKFKN